MPVIVRSVYPIQNFHEDKMNVGQTSGKQGRAHCDETDTAKPSRGRTITPKKSRSADVAGPDGPFSWFIAALSFLVSLFYSSFYRCSGLFFTSIMTTFGTTREEASLPLAIYAGFSCLASLPAGPLIHSYGLRVTTVLGGILISLGCIVSLFASGTSFLVVSIGVLAGSGHGVLQSCLIVLINHYFEKKVGAALGVNNAGSATASLLFTNIFQLCLAEYGLKLTLAYAGALMLNIPVIAIFFRYPPWRIRPKPKYARQRGPKSKDDGECKIVSLKAYRITVHQTGVNVTSTPVETSLPDSAESAVPQRKEKTHYSSVANASIVMSIENVDRALACPLQKAPSHRDKKCVPGESTDTTYTASTTQATSAAHPRDDQHATHPCRAPQCQVNSKTHSIRLGVSREYMACGLKAEHNSRKGSTTATSADLSTGTECLGLYDSARDIEGYGSTGEIVADHPSNKCDMYKTGTVPVSPSSQPDVTPSPLETDQETLPSILSSARTVLSLPCFYTDVVGYFTIYFFFDTLMAIVVDLATDRGISEDNASHILQMFSVADIAGRVLVPLLADYKIVGRLSLMTLSFLLTAIIWTALPAIHMRVVYAALVIAVGLPMGYLMVSVPQTIAADVGLDHLPIAYGFAAGASTVGAFMTPSIIGVFRDIKGSYDGLLYLMGAMAFISFIIWIFLCITNKEAWPKFPCSHFKRNKI
ncbi:uncharacterized protein [Dermacentor albipictus]|uniref:uncharacterized protein n=1 Tax=Dermacentor albipictus TaxID=60249 RepID=UPI0031FDFE48